MDAANLVTIAASAAALFSLFCLIAYQRSLGRELLEARRETSRFELFAARDEFICLVADGHMKADDAAWRSSYEATNEFLKLEKTLDALDYLRRYWSFLVAMENDPRLKKKVERLQHQQEQAMERVPAFAAAQAKMEHGFWKMVARRSGVGQLILLITVGVGFMAARAVAAPFQMGVKKAWRVFVDAVTPSPARFAAMSRLCPT